MEALDDNYLNYHHQMIYQTGDQQQQQQQQPPLQQQQSHRQAHYLSDTTTSGGQQCLYPPSIHNKSSGRMAPPMNPMSPLATGHAHPNGMPSQQQQHSPGGGNHMNFGSKNANYVQTAHYHVSPLGSPSGVVEQQQQPAVSNYGSYVGGNSNLHNDMIDISNTLTHISETDTSNYPTPPMPQTQLVGRNSYQTPPTRFNSYAAQIQTTHVPQANQWPNANCANKTSGVDSACSKTTQQHYSSNANRAFHPTGGAYEMSTSGHGLQQPQPQQQYRSSQAVHHGDYQHSITSTPVVTSKEAAKFHSHSHTVSKVGVAGGGGGGGYFYNSNQASNVHQHQQQQFSNLSQQQRHHRQPNTNGFRTNGTNLSITKEKTTTQVANDTNELMPDESATIQDFQNLPSSGSRAVVADHNGSGGGTYERRNLIVFKVVEQLIDPVTKRVVKETIIKNDEITTSVGLVHLNGLVNEAEIGNEQMITPTVAAATSTTSRPTSNDSRATTSGLSSLNHSTVGSSGNLADISSNVNSKSSTGEVNQSSIEEEEEDKFAQSETVSMQADTISESESMVVPQTFVSNIEENEDKDDEEERRQTVSALLSLQTPTKMPCTPTPADEDISNGQLNTPVFPRHIVEDIENVKTNFNNILTNEPVATLERTSPTTLSICSLSTNVVSSSSSSGSSPHPAGNTKFYGCLKVNMKVLAKWKDRKYYGAVLSKKLEANKWMVKFDDGAVRNLVEGEIVQPEALFPGTEVMVNLSEDADGSMICQVAKVTQLIKVAVDVFEFELEHLDREQKDKICDRYKLDDIFLNSEQGAQIISRMARPSGAVYGEVDLDNIVSGKRIRGKQIETTEKRMKDTKMSASPAPASTSFVTANEESTSQAASLLDVNNNNRKRRKPPTTEESTDEQVSSKTPKKIENKRKRGFRNDVPSRNDQQSDSSSSNAPNSNEPSKPPTKAKDRKKKKIEPSPVSEPKPGDLFRGIAFLLIPHDRVKEDRSSRSDPFDKIHLTELIQAGGGSIFETFDDMKASNLECVLISDTYHRSVEYIQCLAGGVPILSHLWVVESSRQGQLQPKEAHFLPAGYDEITHTLSSDKNVFKKSFTLFRDAKIYFGSSQPDKIKSPLAPILKAARAVIVEQNPNMSTTLTKKMVDIIVADSSCPPELVARAKSCRVPVISTEYIIQCLINGKRLSTEASPTFSYTYQSPN